MRLGGWPHHFCRKSQFFVGPDPLRNFRLRSVAARENDAGDHDCPACHLPYSGVPSCTRPPCALALSPSTRLPGNTRGRSSTIRRFQRERRTRGKSACRRVRQWKDQSLAHRSARKLTARTNWPIFAPLRSLGAVCGRSLLVIPRWGSAVPFFQTEDLHDHTLNARNRRIALLLDAGSESVDFTLPFTPTIPNNAERSIALGTARSLSGQRGSCLTEARASTSPSGWPLCGLLSPCLLYTSDAADDLA